MLLRQISHDPMTVHAQYCPVSSRCARRAAPGTDAFSSLLPPACRADAYARLNCVPLHPRSHHEANLVHRCPEMALRAVRRWNGGWMDADWDLRLPLSVTAGESRIAVTAAYIPVQLILSRHVRQTAPNTSCVGPRRSGHTRRRWIHDV